MHLDGSWIRLRYHCNSGEKITNRTGSIVASCPTHTAVAAAIKAGEFIRCARGSMDEATEIKEPRDRTKPERLAHDP